MKMKQNKLVKLTTLLILGLFLFLSACQSVQDGLQGKKKDNTDEFLVQKKNPLVLPPDFDDLPEPKNTKNKSNDSDDIEDLLNSASKDNNSNSSDPEKESLENSIKKILNEK